MFVIFSILCYSLHMQLLLPSQYRPLDVVDEQTRRFRAGEPFISLPPEDLGAVPGLFVPEVWDIVRKNDYYDQNDRRGTFDEFLAAEVVLPPNVLDIAKAIVDLEVSLYPNEPPSRRYLSWFARIDSHNFESAIPHFDSVPYDSKRRASAQTLYSSASRDGTTGISGLNRIPKLHPGSPARSLRHPVKGSKENFIRDEVEIAKIREDDNLAIVNGRGKVHTTKAGHLHRFDGLHNFPKPQHQTTPPERLFHSFRVGALPRFRRRLF